VDRVVLELVHHVFDIHERVIDSSDDRLGVVHGGTADEPADATEAVDADADAGV